MTKIDTTDRYYRAAVQQGPWADPMTLWGTTAEVEAYRAELDNNDAGRVWTVAEMDEANSDHAEVIKRHDEAGATVNVADELRRLKAEG